MVVFLKEPALATPIHQKKIGGGNFYFCPGKAGKVQENREQMTAGRPMKIPRPTAHRE